MITMPFYGIIKMRVRTNGGVIIYDTCDRVFQVLTRNLNLQGRHGHSFYGGSMAERNEKGQYVKGHKTNVGHKFTDEQKRNVSHGLTGLHPSEETRQKMSEAKKGKPSPNKGKKRTWKGNSFEIGHAPWNKGSKMPEEHCKKLSDSYTYHVPWNRGLTKEDDERIKRLCEIMSEARKGKRMGEEHPNWKGGKSKIDKTCRMMPEYAEWRTKVYERDDFTCQYCGERGGQLEAHHLKRFAQIIKENDIKTIIDARDCSEMWNTENGITLCINCHGILDPHRNSRLKKKTKEAA